MWGGGGGGGPSHFCPYPFLVVVTVRESCARDYSTFCIIESVDSISRDGPDCPYM